MRTIAARVSPYLWRRTRINLQPRRFSTSGFGRDEQSIEQEAERKVGWLLKLIFAGTATLIGYQIFPYMGDNLMQQSVSLLQVKDPLFKRMGASRLARFAIDDEKRMKIVEIGGAQHLLNMLESARDDCTRKEALKALFAVSKSVAMNVQREYYDPPCIPKVVPALSKPSTCGISPPDPPQWDLQRLKKGDLIGNSLLTTLADWSHVDPPLILQTQPPPSLRGLQVVFAPLNCCSVDAFLKSAVYVLFGHEAAVVLHQAGAISIIKSTLESAEDAEVGKYKSNLLSRFLDLSYDISS
ncbi:hypothetical protein RND71_018529 [Anisodus tanguticus]|uniref:ARM repeat superfamily protein n=1 Tax=Anisodus tanguticus TaxID=243964 RepID=A0AAE1S5U8_9SOLA|nr:hypothetical protein RND71_018529 [Anisodus tanguticus]